MPDLSRELFRLFAEVIDKYTHSTSKMEEYINYVPRFARIAGAVSSIANELTLGKEKRKELARLKVIFEQELSPRRESDLSSQSQFEDMRNIISSRASDTTSRPLSPREIVATPKVYYYQNIATKSHHLDNLAQSIENEIKAINELRAKHPVKRAEHPVGQSDGILKAMQRSLFCLIRVYNRRTIYLLEDIDQVSSMDHAVLQWINYIAYVLCVVAYDYELANYADSKQGHVIDAQYYLGSGLQKKELKERRKEIFMGLDAKLKLLIINYLLKGLFTTVKNNPAADVSAYIEKLTKILMSDRNIDAYNHDQTDQKHKREFIINSAFRRKLIDDISQNKTIEKSILMNEIAILDFEISYVIDRCLVNGTFASLELSEAITQFMPVDALKLYEEPALLPKRASSGDTVKDIKQKVDAVLTIIKAEFASKQTEALHEKDALLNEIDLLAEDEKLQNDQKAIEESLALQRKESESDASIHEAINNLLASSSYLAAEAEYMEIIQASNQEILRKVTGNSLQRPDAPSPTGPMPMYRQERWLPLYNEEQANGRAPLPYLAELQQQSRSEEERRFVLRNTRTD